MAEKEEIDDTLEGDAADTVAAAADDTLAADAAEDTVVADAADDTLAGDAGDKSPFDEFGEPATKKEEAKAALADTPTDDGDALDKRLEAAEAKLLVDHLDENANKEYREASKAVTQRDRKRLQAMETQVHRAAESAAYERFEQTCGLPEAPPDVRKKLTRDVIKARFQKHFDAERKVSGDDNEARGAARANLRHEIKAIIQAAGKSKPAPKTNRTAAGAGLTPPGGVGGRPGKAEVKPEDVFVKGDWTYPIPIGNA